VSNPENHLDRSLAGHRGCNLRGNPDRDSEGCLDSRSAGCSAGCSSNRPERNQERNLRNSEADRLPKRPMGCPASRLLRSADSRLPSSRPR